MCRRRLAPLTLALILAGWPALAEPPEPAPEPDAGTRILDVLEARDSGAIKVETRGDGGERVRLTIRNVSPRRLLVVFPPGLVASAAAGQVQSMGLGDPANDRVAFGKFPSLDASSASEPFSESDAPRARGVAVPVGRVVVLRVPAVCLDFGAPTPTADASFTLMDVDDFTANPTARKALRTIAAIGTGHGVAQAVAWHTFNGLSFDDLASQHVYPLNGHEVALAAGLARRIALGVSGEGEGEGGGSGIDPSRDRLFVQVRGEGPLSEAADRLGPLMAGRRLLGLPARAESGPETPLAPALRLGVALAPAVGGKVGGKVAVRYAAGGGRWTVLGSAPLRIDGDADALNAPALAEAVDRAVAAAFVTVRPVGRSANQTTLRVDNRLPFTLAHLVVKAGEAPVTLSALGIGPHHHANAPIEAARATVDRVVLNGL